MLADRDKWHKTSASTVNLDKNNSTTHYETDRESGKDEEGRRQRQIQHNDGSTYCMTITCTAHFARPSTSQSHVLWIYVQVKKRPKSLF